METNDKRRQLEEVPAIEDQEPERFEEGDGGPQEDEGDRAPEAVCGVVLFWNRAGACGMIPMDPAADRRVERLPTDTELRAMFAEGTAQLGAALVERRLIQAQVRAQQETATNELAARVLANQGGRPL